MSFYPGPSPVYEYPADPPPPRLPWLAIVGATVAVIALAIAAIALIVPRVSKPVAAPPTQDLGTVTVTVPTVLSIPPPSPSTVTMPPPAPPAPPEQRRPPEPVVNDACDVLRIQADADDPHTRSEAMGYWVPQLSSKRPGLVAEGITWDCDSILAEHQNLRATYQADLLWSGDYPNTYHNGGDYWVTVAAWIFPTADGARQWCVDHGRDIPEHCYPTQIK